MFAPWSRSILVGLLVVLLMAVAVPVQGQVSSAPGEFQEEEQLMLELINGARAERGLPSLEFDPELAVVAEEHAYDMIERDYFAHRNPDGLSPADRARRHQIPFRILGENLAGNTDVRDAHRMLMESDGHRANILEDRYGRVGISIVDGGRYGKMMVMKFADGAPRVQVNVQEPASASDSRAAASGPTVLIDGQQVIIEDSPPQLVDGRTMVPLRGVFEALGARVDWDGNSRTVTAAREDIRVQLTIGESHMLVNGQEVALDVPGRLENGRTLVPLRAISESLGVQVEWDQDSRTVNISSS